MLAPALSCVFYSFYDEDYNPHHITKNYCKQDKEVAIMPSLLQEASDERTRQAGIPTGIGKHTSLDVIENAISQLHLAKQLATEAESLKSQASAILMPYMASVGLKTYDSRTVHGAVAYVAPGITKKFSKEKAAQELLVSGVSADVIQSAHDHATSEGPKAGYVKFVPTKET